MSLNKSKALRTAEKYVLQGKLPAAIDEYRKVVDADPTDLTTINTLGDLYVRAGKIQDAINNFSRIAESYRESGFTLKAIAMLKKISKLDPTNVETAMKLANLYSQQGLLVEARQQYLQVADAYARAGQTRKALDAYQKIADLDPANTSVRMKLGEIYSREGMTEQAHESFIMAGAEFLRKGDTEQALNANLRAISINPESRQGLTAIATIYTQQGQANRAISILCDAFEKSPGDVELLTILGRTYLSAGLMDEAERTFLSLVELDRNRYHYLLEVGRRFLQMGDLNRAAEQIDGCIEVLIAKREEDKAIDFLRRVLDRDMNHIGSLKRLGQIFLRIREDHNLIATLNSLAEAAMRKGEDQEAIAALTELARLEPDEPLHRQRLYNLGVRDIVESDSPEVVRATGPLDYESAAFDDTFVIRQISEAEILAGHGQVEHAVSILREILNHTPDNVQVHSKLKDIYLRAGVMDKAAEECLELARVYEARGESSRASDFVAEARQLNPSLEGVAPPRPSWPAADDSAFGFNGGFGVSHGSPQGGSFNLQQDPAGFDLARYQTGPLMDQTGFVTVPEDAALPRGAAGKEHTADHPASAPPAQAFRYGDTLVGEAGDAGQGANPAEVVFTSAGNIPSDTVSRILREELEGIDFYLAQGYVEIARDTLDRLREEHGLHPEILARYTRLGVEVDEVPAEPDGAGPQTAEPHAPQPFLELAAGKLYDAGGNGAAHDVAIKVGPEHGDPLPAAQEDLTFNVARSPREGERKNALPFIITKESGPLQSDLMVQLNTSELMNTSDLLNDTAFDSLRAPTGALHPIVAERVGTADLIESIVSTMDASFETVQQLKQEPNGHAEAAPPACAEFESRQVDEAPLAEALSDAEPAGQWPAAELYDYPGAEPEGQVEQSAAVYEPAGNGTELSQIFEDLKDGAAEVKPLIDFETHYSLGLAYKDMDLLDEAIEQFQMAFKRAGDEDLEGNYTQCCHLLGVCFKRKSMPKVAIMWFQRGLNIPNRTEDEYQALRYEIGLCYEEVGDIDKAIDIYMEVYGIDVNYREVDEKIKQLQSAKDA
jgi:tetratricopeptide (TPR) repeat protein